MAFLETQSIAIDGMTEALSNETSIHADFSCRNCHAPNIDIFYRTGDVPVHSCMMMDSKEAAQSFPRLPIVLGFCKSCGFVSNVIFDECQLHYNGRYEDQQSFSERFCAFQTNLIRRLIDRYSLAGKRIVEIGSGKGDFLIELCRAARATGIGIDPRHGSEHNISDGSVQFVAEHFGPQHARFACDFVCCRHTFEHIAHTDRLISQLRQALDGKPNSLVFFEVPDASRIWKEKAFWEVYYEHCSYFSPGSLAEVFRRNRFEIIELDRIFGDQYLLIVARPVAEVLQHRLSIEESITSQVRDVDAFRIQIPSRIAYWKERLACWRSSGKRVAVWGAGSKCVSFLTALECADLIECIVDINPNQQGKFMPGITQQIVSPDALRVHRPDVVLMMNVIYCEEINSELSRMRLNSELLGV